MTKKKIIILGLIGIGCATVGYTLGKHGTVSVEFLKKAVAKAYGLGVDTVIEFVDPEDNPIKENGQAIFDRFVTDASIDVDLKTGIITTILDDGTAKSFTD